MEQISKKTVAKWYQRVQYLIEHQDVLTEWELGFVESIDRQMDLEKKLTLKQSYKLGDIYHRVEERDG